MVRRAQQAKQAAETKAPSSFTHFREGYAKPFASALLNEDCRGGKALSDKTREELEDLSQRQSEDGAAVFAYTRFTSLSLNGP